MTCKIKVDHKNLMTLCVKHMDHVTLSFYDHIFRRSQYPVDVLFSPQQNKSVQSPSDPGLGYTWSNESVNCKPYKAQIKILL